MAANNYNSNNRQRSGNNNTKKKQNDLAEIETVMPVDEQFKEKYVDIAHDVMVSLDKDKDNVKVISKTKIRSLYNMLCDIIDNEKHSPDKEKLASESVSALRIFKVRVIYDCGRDNKDTTVKDFVMRSHIIGYMLDIGDDKSKFEAYCKYFEALIAYHRFLYGDKD